MASSYDFIGKGFSFPFSFDERTGGVRTELGTGIDGRFKKIEDALRQIIGVTIGTMFMTRDFGSDMRAAVFLPNNASIERIIEFTIIRSIGNWEHRVILNTVEINRFIDRKDLIEINIRVTESLTNNTKNFVFPFYLSGDDRTSGEETVTVGS